ncbi:MAG: adenylosuccinate lyase [Thermoplasmatales archaeon]|nr:adenylosuccinate lyase [Thermoplasmatales archaeon]
MMICPIEFRYGRNEIKNIFSEESRLSYWLKVEAKLARAHAFLGNIPKKAADEIEKKANIKYVKIERVKEIEKEIGHDVMAMVKALSEKCEYGKYVHLGATSYDIVDTANALQIRDALNIIEKELIELLGELLKLANKHKKSVMIGRTHGQHALPITFGLKMAVYADEIFRHLIRLREVREEISYGKMSGAVGTGASFGDKFFELQEFVMKELNLKPEIPSTQIVGRDRYVELLSFLANLSASIEKFATEIRNLQRTEIAEAEEFFEEKQVGSSTMPHKRNPVTCEQICGLARVIRSNLLPAWENAIQWHERDLCNSSSERFIIPHSLILTDWIVYKMRDVFSKLKVNTSKMRENIEISKGAILSEAIMMRLVEKGMGRQEAHELMRKYSMEARKKNVELREVVSREIAEIIDEIGDYYGNAEKIVDFTLEKIRKEFPDIAL